MVGKYLYLTLVFVLGSQTLSLAQWTILPNVPFISGNRIDNLHFRSRDHGIFVTGNGEVYTTFDGGQDWLRASFTDTYFRSIDFMNDSVGFVGSLTGTFLKTTDGGKTWSNIRARFPGGSPLICGLSCTQNRAFAVGFYAEPARLYISDDEGETWVQSNLDSLLSGAVDVYFLNDEVGYIAGIGINRPNEGKRSYATIIQTLDGGASWSIVGESDLPTSIAWKMAFLESGKIFASVQNFSNNTVSYLTAIDPSGPYHSVSFQHLGFDVFDPQGIGFLNDQVGWIAGYGFGIYETNDGGDTWEYLPQTININRFFKINSNQMVASGRFMYLYEENVVSINEKDMLSAKERLHAILNISPNPAYARIQLSYRLDSHTAATLDIFSLDGSIARRIYQKDQVSGTYDLDIDISQLPPGMFMVLLRTNERHISKRFVKY
jgi:photosystem II stability/assembly factor-like uncharacterized protein